MISGGACTNSIRTPSPPIGDSSLPFGWMNVMSCPAAPLRIPPGAKRTPCAVSHSTARGQVVDPEPHVIERRIVHGGLPRGIDGLHEVDLAARQPLAGDSDVLVDVLALAAELPFDGEPEAVDPEVAQACLARAANGDLLHAEDPEGSASRSLELSHRLVDREALALARQELRDHARRARPGSRSASSSPRSRRGARPPSPPGPAFTATSASRPGIGDSRKRERSGGAFFGIRRRSSAARRGSTCTSNCVPRCVSRY